MPGLRVSMKDKNSLFEGRTREKTGCVSSRKSTLHIVEDCEWKCGNGDAWKWGRGNGDAGKKVTKPYSINCNPFSRAMLSPLSTEKPTPGGLISNRLASSLSDIPNSLTAQKQKKLLAFTFR